MAPNQSDPFEKLAADAVAHHTAGRLDEAEAAYRRALELSPGHTAITHNRATITATHGDHTAAIALFDQVIAAEPHHIAAHFNRAAAHQASGTPDKAIEDYRRTCALDPAHYDAHRALAFLTLATGDRGRALDHFARTYDLRRGEDHATIANKSLTHASRAKLRHDAEQFRYLSSRHRDARRFELLAKSYGNIAKIFPAEPAALTALQQEQLGDDYNTAINVFGAAEIPDPAINPELDRQKITAEIETNDTATIDNLLTPAALERFRRYLLESTVWHDFSHIGGFVAAYLEDGLASPLLLQIADEFRGTLPDLLSDKQLTQAWAFKGLEPASTVNLHADDAAISLNFWVTPDAANLDTGRGGLMVYRKPPPAEWVIDDYNADQKRIRDFLRDHASEVLNIPYRCNRAVLFRSRLFHGSDRPNFAPSYENHRINVTLLFGTQAN